MADKLLYITNDDTQDYHFYYKQCLKRLDIHLNEQTNQTSVQVVEPTNKKTLL